MIAEDHGRLRRSVRDHIPTYWVPEAPRLVGALMFRAGRADEPPVRCGITHIVEHLVLHVFGTKPPCDCNGFVDGNRTVFYASGEPDEVATFMRGICHAIAALPLERLQAECRVLRTEAMGRNSSPAELMQWWRFGARGQGRMHLREFAVEVPDAEQVRAWAARYFTADNATAWFSGPVPDGVSFAELPRGERMTLAEPAAVAGLETPAWLKVQQDTISISMLSEREDWLNLSLRMAALRIHHQLRFRDGLTYAISMDYQPISSTRAHHAVWTSSLPEHGAAVQRGFVEALEEMARTGPTPEEFEEARKDMNRSHADPDWANGYLDRAAHNELIEYTVRGPEDAEHELAKMTAERCAATMTTALETALLVIPQGCAHPEGWHGYPTLSSTILRGRRYRSVGQGMLPWSRKMPELIVSDEGVSWLGPMGQTVTVSYAECAVAVVYPSGEIEMVGDDGFVLWIRAGEWRNGNQALASVRNAMPDDRTVVLPAR